MDKLKCALVYMLCVAFTTFGISMAMFLVYVVICNPETLTTYEQIVTYVLGAAVSSRMIKVEIKHMEGKG